MCIANNTKCDTQRISPSERVRERAGDNRVKGGEKSTFHAMCNNVEKSTYASLTHSQFTHRHTTQIHTQNKFIEYTIFLATAH